MECNSGSRPSSRDLSYYWGFLSRDAEVSILSQSEDGAYLLRDCLSHPNACTLAVRSGDQICRYRIAEEDLFDVTLLTTCFDFDGKPVTLGKPVERPQVVMHSSRRSQRRPRFPSY